MRKSIKLVSLMLVLVMLVAVLASCAKSLSGVYTAEIGGDLAGAKHSLNFKSGKTVVFTVTTTLVGNSDSKEYEGEYKIEEADDGTMSITFTFEDDGAKEYNGTKTFTEDKDDGTITIGGIEYKKQD